MAVQSVCFSFFGITNYNDNNNIKPLMVKLPPRHFILDRIYRNSSSESCLSNPLADSIFGDGIFRYRLRSSTIEAVPSDLDSSNRTTFLVWSSYHTGMHWEERCPSHRGVSRWSHHELWTGNIWNVRKWWKWRRFLVHRNGTCRGGWSRQIGRRHGCITGRCCDT